MTLSYRQRLFLCLHKYHVVKEWREVLGGGSVRATCSRGITITLGHHEVMPLAEAGIVRRGSGNSIYLTEKGNACV